MRTSKPLRAGKPLRMMSDKKRAEVAEHDAVRMRVFHRDGYRCRLAGVDGAGACFGPLTPHHVLKAAQGGAYDDANLVTLCSSHNDRLEADADLARLGEQLGIVRRRYG